MTRSNRLQGFSLLEMSVVLLIIAVVVGGAAATLTASMQQNQFDETKRKLLVIQKAILDYRRVNNRIPCPGDLTLPVTDNSFGVAAAKKPATNNSCNSASPAATFTNGSYAVGSIPTKTLNLSDDYMFDGWGRRFTYMVEDNFTTPTAFNDIPVSDTAARIDIWNEEKTSKNARAIYALISHGQNGHGAYSRNGDKRISTGSVNTHEQYNCFCDSGAGDTGVNGYVVQREQSINSADPLDSFDDLVVFATRQDLRLSTE